MTDSKRIQLIICLLALVPWLLFAYLGQTNRLISDDDCNLVDARNEGPWGYMHTMYNKHGGRYTTYLFRGIVAPLDTTLLPRITSAITMILWLVGWYWLVFQSLGFLKIDNSRPALSIVISALTVSAMMHGLDSFHFESLYFHGALAVHTLPIVLFTLCMALAVWMARRLRKNILSCLRVIAVGMICFLVAGFSEMQPVYQLLFLTFCLLMSFALPGNSVRYRYAAVFGVSWLASLASLAVQLAAPGIPSRLAMTVDRYGPVDWSISAVASKTLDWSFNYIKDADAFTGFIMLISLGLLAMLVKYKPPALSKASKSFELTSPALWTGLIFHLICLPLLWLHTSDNPQFLGRFSSRYMILILLNILVILSFLVMLWGRKRINAQLQKREPGLLFLCWFMAAVFILALLFALTQSALYFYSSLYLFTSLLVLMVVLTSLYSSAKERKLGWLACCSYGLACISILTAVFLLSARGHVESLHPRVLAFGVCLLVLSGLVWGAWLGYLAKRYLPSLQAGQARMRLLKLGSLVIVLIFAANIVLNQAAHIPDYQNFARIWDANHQKILAGLRDDQDIVEVSRPSPSLRGHYYHKGCPGRYYGLGPKVIITDD